MDVREVQVWIINHASKTDIDAIYEATRQRRGILAALAGATFKIGDRVKWTATRGRRKGLTYRGKITKKFQKNFGVEATPYLGETKMSPSSLWRVPPDMMELDPDPLPAEKVTP